ncbi:MAG: peptidoglycan-binding protein [Clostridia bacterium]|nr:peptidoglycan-binding protein [Clostridia bacterium]
MYPFNDIRYDRKLYIRELQQYLRRLSTAYPAIPRVNVDGVYGAAMGRAVGAFQKRFGLPETRQTDRVTWETIHSEYRRLLEREAFPGDIVPLALPLIVGDDNAAVALLNEWLYRLFDHYPHLPAPTPGSMFTPDTARAVSSMQQILLLPVNGVVDHPTWRGIRAAVAALSI